ncbi:hypothetical protein [Thioalkalivibrio sp. ALE17]|uniref:PilY2 family type 4a fimbrial biogenesis protein n=1 Tax=Thioalkalivibrio sp. ALE17 TaxID=1158173 RepID=UPI00048C3482|nr:hypothetical protein [Thioalkalivibrio sp. ALE17]
MPNMTRIRKKPLLLGSLFFLAFSASNAADDYQGFLVGQVTAVNPTAYTITIDRTTYRVPHTTAFYKDDGRSGLQDVQEGLWIRFQPVEAASGLPRIENPTLFSSPQE